ncbi:PREDICTED: 85/88 kDa calcium-independent phospholipase A2-like [Amphimedon queenslandica]|uniref:phospholipase A2 n=1 Tax=Amphimedon queenslandica TaxID=400682 RepID=A0A1X7VV01_AMPQE|nr:PREDICTED: 85/88 kDa calcium-independent phospholipase A2-like [Amphimedon queenslandica]|eukprot:XP_011403394.1 PREDICTED: 85/88 kDa calcium-independent phospholipase A2-like [Amphimedon queenslandica]
MAKRRKESVDLDVDDYTITEKLWEKFRKVPARNLRARSINRRQTGHTDRRSLLRQGSISFDYYESGGKTPLMKAVEKGYIKTTLNLLLFGSDPDIRDEETGSTALHLAVERCDITLVKALIAFNADTTIANRQNETPLDVAENIKEEKQTPTIRKGLLCAAVLFVPLDSMPKAKKREIKEEAQKGDISPIIEVLKKARDSQAKSFEYFTKNPTIPPRSKNQDDVFLLSLDGGGIRIFNIMQALIAIEERMLDLDPDKRRLYTYFDYIAGTSGGGMVAACMYYLQADCYNIRAMISKGLIYVLKSSASEKGEKFNAILQDIFTEDECLSDLDPRYRVIITATLTEYTPYKLHLMTSYGGSRDGQAGPKERKVWEACRVSTAAPAYFPRLRDLPLLDGGLVSNNPTLDSMAEIIEQGKREGKPAKFGCVLSVGTGLVTSKHVDEAVELYATSPFSLLSCKNLRSLQSLASHFLNQATLCDGQEVDRARAFCDALGCQYFRLTPSMDTAIDLATTDEKELIDMMYNSQMYYLDNPQIIDDVAKYLLSRK